MVGETDAIKPSALLYIHVQTAVLGARKMSARIRVASPTAALPWFSARKGKP
jgi:hypothetical protein